jgi:molecular chaperone GrpE
LKAPWPIPIWIGIHAHSYRRFVAAPATMTPEENHSGSRVDANPATDDATQARAAEPASALEAAQAEAAELKDAWLRARADVENVRRQGQADVLRAHKYAIEKFAEDLLAVKDALEQTLGAGQSVSPETLKTGADLTLKALNAAFGRAQITEIDPSGQKFDPHLHQAMQAVDSDLPSNTVVAVFQKGYLLNDRVLRPALVTVSKAPESRGGNGSPG